MNNMPYSQWIEELNDIIEDWSGVSLSDLADYPFKLWYNDGVEPIEAAEWIQEQEGF